MHTSCLSTWLASFFLALVLWKLHVGFSVYASVDDVIGGTDIGGSFYHGNSDEECVQSIREGRHSHSIESQHVLNAMRRGFWKCTAELITHRMNHKTSVASANSLSISSMEMRNEIEMESRLIMKEISAIKTLIEGMLPMNTITPAFQWAQSSKEVFLNIKFAHKLDAPATLNVEITNMTFDGSKVQMIASDGRKIFNLTLDLLREIIPEESNWSLASVGRLTVTLKKRVEPSAWPRLLKTKINPGNMHFWWELHEKYTDELDNLKEEDEEKNGDKKNEKKTAGDKPVVGDNEKDKESKKEKKIKPALTEAEKERNAERAQLEKLQRDEIERIEEEARNLKRAEDMKAIEAKRAIDEEFNSKKDHIIKKFIDLKAEVEERYQRTKLTHQTDIQSEVDLEL